MLNSILVEQFGSIHRQGKSGVLTVVGPDLRLRFCVENGDPVALDFCTDKDLVLANTLLDFHKIGPEMYQVLVESRKMGKGTVSDMVRRQQVVNDEEIAQMTRSMVEDTLVRCFGTPHQEMIFDERDDAGTFDFDHSAIRLRIGTSVLLNTVQMRVAEVDRVMSEIGGNNAIFSLSENETGSGPLSDYEKHVLNFIDGHKTIEEIAVAFRESSLSMARLLCSMAQRGVIKRTVQGGVSRLRAAVAAPEINETTQSRVTPQLLPEFVPHRGTPQQKSANLALRLVLIAALILVSAVGYLVIDSQKRSQVLDTTSQTLVDQLVVKKWVDAGELIKKAREQTGNDLSAIELVDALAKKYDAAIQQECAVIEKLTKEQDFEGARKLLAQLPVDRQPAALLNNITNADQALQKRSNALVQQVASFLDRGNAAQAMLMLSSNPGKIGEAATEYVQRWRLSSLERAGSSSLPLSQRSALVNQILATDPAPHQRDQIERIRNEFSRLQQRTAEVIRDLSKQAEMGAFIEVEKEWERLHLGDQLKGTPLAAEAEALRVLNDIAARELRALEATGLQLLEWSGDVKEMGGYSDQIKQALGKRSLASNGDVLQMNAQLLNELSGLVGDRTALDEANAINLWLQEHQQSPTIVSLVHRRIQRLRDINSSALQALDTARSFARQNDWDANERLLKEILARKEWQRTSAFTLAKQDLGSIDSIRGQQKAWEEELQQAMLRGDKERSHALSQRMGLRYLPIVIHSKPLGAQVIRDGKIMGQTPYIMNIPAGERANLELVVQLKGFNERRVSANTAEGGWFLPVELERTNSGSLQLNMTVTSKPTAIGDRLWVASRQQCAAIAPGKAPERIAFENPGASNLAGQPLYAGAYSNANGVYYPTREGFVIRIAHGKKNAIERMAIPAKSDLAIATYESELIVGRRYVITAGLDGVLYTSDETTSLVVWKGKQGAPFICAPIVLGDQIVIARANGVIESYLPDDGSLVEQLQCDGPLLSAWFGEGVLHGITYSNYYRYSGNNSIERSPLPQEAKSAGNQVYLTPDNRAFIWQDKTWIDVGKCDGRVSAQPLAWAGHAVIPCGTSMIIVGPQGFTLSGGVEFLAPVVVGSQLAVTTLEGDVHFYLP
jgi:hypothetical protein